MGYDLKLRVWRGDAAGGALGDYTVEVSEAVARAALAREESRGGHTRDDFPATSSEWGARNLVVTLDAHGTGVALHEKPLPVMPEELKTLFETT